MDPKKKALTLFDEFQAFAFKGKDQELLTDTDGSRGEGPPPSLGRNAA